jgi:hypothetical protein
MGRSYKSHCFSTLVQAGDDTLNHLIQNHDPFLNPSLVPADLKILAKDALQITMGKEYVTDAIGPTDNRFLTLVDTD